MFVKIRVYMVQNKKIGTGVHDKLPSGPDDPSAQFCLQPPNKGLESGATLLYFATDPSRVFYACPGKHRSACFPHFEIRSK